LLKLDSVNCDLVLKAIFAYYVCFMEGLLRTVIIFIKILHSVIKLALSMLCSHMGTLPDDSNVPIWEHIQVGRKNPAILLPKCINFGVFQQYYIFYQVYQVFITNLYYSGSNCQKKILSIFIM
jgi:hypothetical protein